MMNNPAASSAALDEMNSSFEPLDAQNINIPLDETEQIAIVQKCLDFKEAVKQQAREKKMTMSRCYAYAKSEFVGGDLLPRPRDANGDEHSNDANRPDVFIPLSRQQAKTIYSQTKLTIFPNDSDYFRVFGYDEEAAKTESDLTEAVKYLFKKARVTELLGKFIWNAVIFGTPAALPTLRIPNRVKWEFKGLNNGRYVGSQQTDLPIPFLENFNPIHFYPDPNASDSEQSAWSYLWHKNIYEFYERPDLYFNLDKLETVKGGKDDSRRENGLDLRQFNGLQQGYKVSEDIVDYDLYYFPWLKTETQLYENMLIGIAGDQVLVRCHPSTFPDGYNPAVWTTWMPDVDSPYGTSPMEDIIDLQTIVNIMTNYNIEQMARNGNMMFVNENVDVSNLFGSAGGIGYTKGQPGDDVMLMPADMSQTAELFNAIGMFKAEAQITTGSQNPFQGASNIDFKKTATELQILQENAMTILREVIEHLCVTGIQPILERWMLMIGEAYQGRGAIPFRVDGPQGTQYLQVDLGVLASGSYGIEVTSVNLAQSKMAMSNSLKELLGMASDNPVFFQMLRDGGYHVFRKLFNLEGFKDTDTILLDPAEQQQMMGGMMGGPMPPGAPMPPDGAAGPPMDPEESILAALAEAQNAPPQ